MRETGQKGYSLYFTTRQEIKETAEGRRQKDEKHRNFHDIPGE